jgi:hypothetical protein
MPAIRATQIKDNIFAKLTDLQGQGIIRFAVVDDIKSSPIIDKDIPDFPAVILSTGSTDSVVGTNRDNIRTYTFTLLVVMRGDDVGSSNDVETLCEQILQVFDNDPTLGGFADAGLEPATSTPDSINSQDKTYVTFTVEIKAHSNISLYF